MDKETLRYEISYLEEYFIFIVNSKKSLEDNIEVIIKSSTKNQKNIKRLKKIKKRFCENVVGFKDSFEKFVETLKKYIDELKIISTELESSDIKSIGEKNKYFKSNLVTRQNLEEVFSIFTTNYSHVCANLKKIETLFQKQNETLKGNVKRLLIQFKVLENEMRKIETERNNKVKIFKDISEKRILFCQNQIQQLEEETLGLKEGIDLSFLETEQESLLCVGWGIFGSKRRNQQQSMQLRLEERDGRVESLERQVEEYRTEINELKEQVKNFNRFINLVVKVIQKLMFCK